MGTNGYKTKLNRNGMKVKNIHSNPKSFGMKMNKQKQSAMDNKNISQNLTSLPINVLRNKYNLQINTINLNKVKSISFGGIEDWKKWTDKNPLFKSLVDLQKYTALGAVTAALGKHLGLVSGSILTNCNATKNSSCNNYKEYSLKEYLNLSPSTELLISAIIECADEYIRNKANIVGAGTTFATGNIIIGMLTKFGMQLTESAKIRAITAVTLIESYGGIIIAYLENRRHKNGGDSSGVGGSYDSPAEPVMADRKFFAYIYKMCRQYPHLRNRGHEHFLHVSQILDSEGFDTDFDDIDNFFENIDMDKLKKYHKVYESYMEEYIPKKMDINETYSIKLEKKDKRICIYDEIECEDVFYVKNLPIELLNTISEEVVEEEKEEEAILNVTSYSYTPLHLNTNSYSYNRYGLKNGDGMMLC